MNRSSIKLVIAETYAVSALIALLNDHDKDTSVCAQCVLQTQDALG